MVKEKGKGAGKENGKAKGAGKENGKANGKAKAKEKSLNYLIRQDSPLPLPVPRKKSKPKVQIRKEKDFPNAPMGELICSLKKHPPPPPRLPDRTGAGVRAAEAAASGSAIGSELPHASTIVVEDEEKEEDDEDEEKENEEDDEDEDIDEDKDKEYEEQNLFVVPPLQAGADMSYYIH
ncbi:coiled-coil domain-containing protein 96 [Triticum aestivum]|uniref:coiled-coil domain-containing protein 96 n=1 Tax=Triticum aestivum TaxID=4565 RepID=UPI001D00FEDC|nr:coiled-coil domain-containing protein 96-like [Triticum aestivum]